MYASHFTFAFTSKNQGFAMCILSLHLASHTAELGTTAQYETSQCGMCQALGHAVDADAADLGRRIPLAASVALQDAAGFMDLRRVA